MINHPDVRNKNSVIQTDLRLINEAPTAKLATTTLIVDLLDAEIIVRER